MQHTGDKADTLTQGNEADHNRQNHREQTQDFIHHATEHFSSDNLRQGSSSSSSLSTFSFPNKFMVAGDRFELPS